MALTNQTNIKELSDKGAGGTRLGQSSSDLISFYGQTPTARGSTAVADITTAVAVAITAAGQFGFSSATQLNDLVTGFRTMRTTLINLGLIPSS